VTIFTEPDCKGYSGIAVVNYEVDMSFQDLNKHFLSLDISRTLKDKEQLDINHLGQDDD